MRIPFDWSDDGILWLINRTVFHPRGFALARIPGQPEGDVSPWDAPTEWVILGDGTQPMVFDPADDDRCFQAVEAFFARAKATLP